MKPARRGAERRIGLFGGTFDPIHAGHLHAARAALAAFDLDRVVFVPASTSPHKTHRRSIPGEHRLAAVEIAIAGEPRFSASALELDRGGRSYTIDTVRALPAHLGEHPDCRIFLILGSDNLALLSTWREARALLERVQPIVVHRSDGAARGDGARSGAARSEIARSEVARSEVARSEAARSEVARSGDVASPAAGADATPRVGESGDAGVDPAVEAEPPWTEAERQAFELALARVERDLGPEAARKLRAGYLRLPPVDVSSTDLRARLGSGAEAHELVPAGVLAYLRAHGLYGAGA